MTSSKNFIITIMVDFVDFQDSSYYWIVAGWCVVYYFIGSVTNSTGCAAAVSYTTATADAGSVTIITDDNCCYCTITMANDEIRGFAMHSMPSISLTVQKHSFLYWFSEQR